MPRPDPTRYSYVYHPSRQHKDRWEAMAEKAKVPLTRFIIEIVDSRIDEDEEFKPRQEMNKELADLKKEVKTLRDYLRQKEIVLERYEGELRRYRSQAFQEEDYQGMRRYSKELVEILKAAPVDSYRLLEQLGIDPRESDLVKAVSRQLEELEDYGMIQATAKGGWRWVG